MPVPLVQPSKLAKRAKQYPSLVVQQIAQLEKDYGGREGLVGVLSMAPMTPDLEYLLGQLGDPRNVRQSLAEVCARSYVLPGQLLHVLMSAGQLYIKARAAHLTQQGISPVIADVLRRAAPYEEACTACMVDGKSLGWITAEPTKDQPNPQPEPCPTCRGALRVVVLPELSRQELALELAHLLQKGGGINIQNNQQINNLGGGGHTNVLDQIQQLAEGALYEDGDPLPAIDAEPLPPEEVEA